VCDALFQISLELDSFWSIWISSSWTMRLLSFVLKPLSYAAPSISHGDVFKTCVSSLNINITV
jgi:hypothetical protein